jgi:hypothetical protein
MLSDAQEYGDVDELLYHVSMSGDQAVQRQVMNAAITVIDGLPLPLLAIVMSASEAMQAGGMAAPANACSTPADPSPILATAAARTAHSPAWCGAAFLELLQGMVDAHVAGLTAHRLALMLAIWYGVKSN